MLCPVQWNIYRYLDEVTEVLSAQAPDLREALDRAIEEGLPHVVLDGTLICTDRCREKTLSVRGEPVDLWYCGKARAHGGNVQAVLAPGAPSSGSPPAPARSVISPAPRSS